MLSVMEYTYLYEIFDFIDKYRHDLGMNTEIMDPEYPTNILDHCLYKCISAVLLSGISPPTFINSEIQPCLPACS